MFAHFTAQELPGTLGLVLAAFALGLLAAHRQLKPKPVTIPLLAVLAVTLALAVVSDQPAAHLATWIGTLADVAMLASAGALCAVSVRWESDMIEHRRSSRQRTA